MFVVLKKDFINPVRFARELYQKLRIYPEPQISVELLDTFFVSDPVIYLPGFEGRETEAIEALSSREDVMIGSICNPEEYKETDCNTLMAKLSKQYQGKELAEKAWQECSIALLFE